MGLTYRFNLNRKVFHFCGIFIPLFFFFRVFDLFPVNWFADDTRSILFFILVLFSLLAIAIEILRFQFPVFQNLFFRFVGPLLKDNEINEINGSISYILANAILVGFFPREIAVLAMLFLLFGDPFAAFIGSRYGRTRMWNGRSLEGSLAGIFSAFFFGFLFLCSITLYSHGQSVFSLWDQMGPRPEIWLTLFLGVLSAFILEAVSSKGILDDNLLMPLGSALVMTFLCRIQGTEVDFYPIQKLIYPILD